MLQNCLILRHNGNYVRNYCVCNLTSSLSSLSKSGVRRIIYFNYKYRRRDRRKDSLPLSLTTSLHHVSHMQKVNRVKDRFLQTEPPRADICRNINLSSSSGLIENLIETSVNGCRRIDRALSEICSSGDKTRGWVTHVTTFEANVSADNSRPRR